MSNLLLLEANEQFNGCPKGKRCNRTKNFNGNSIIILLATTLFTTRTTIAATVSWTTENSNRTKFLKFPYCSKPIELNFLKKKTENKSIVGNCCWCCSSGLTHSSNCWKSGNSKIRRINFQHRFTWNITAINGPAVQWINMNNYYLL